MSDSKYKCRSLNWVGCLANNSLLLSEKVERKSLSTIDFESAEEDMRYKKEKYHQMSPDLSSEDIFAVYCRIHLFVLNDNGKG